MTANCVPIVNKRVSTTGPFIYTISSILFRDHVFTITDTMLRESRATRFANLVVQVSYLLTLIPKENRKDKG